MNRSRILAASIGGAVALCIPALVSATSMQTRADYSANIDKASAVYKAARANCEPLSGHMKDMCVVEATAAQKRSKAAAEAEYKGTVKAKTDSRIASADADFMVAKVACDASAGNDKAVCMKQASATHVKLVADAKAHKTSVDARTEARQETREAQYKVELVKCDAMAGAQKDSCVTSAKVAYGK